MYKVSEVAKSAGVTVAGVYKAIKQLDTNYINKQDGVIYISDDGYKILLQRFAMKKNSSNKENSDTGMLSYLLNQLEEKDKQIAEKDRQISQLIEQAKNYQVLLKTEQDKHALSATKQGLFARLFVKAKRTTDN